MKKAIGEWLLISVHVFISFVIVLLEGTAKGLHLLDDWLVDSFGPSQ